MATILIFPTPAASPTRHTYRERRTTEFYTCDHCEAYHRADVESPCDYPDEHYADLPIGAQLIENDTALEAEWDSIKARQISEYEGS